MEKVGLEKVKQEKEPLFFPTASKATTCMALLPQRIDYEVWKRVIWSDENQIHQLGQDRSGIK